MDSTPAPLTEQQDCPPSQSRQKAERGEMAQSQIREETA